VELTHTLHSAEQQKEKETRRRRAKKAAAANERSIKTFAPRDERKDIFSFICSLLLLVLFFPFFFKDESAARGIE
jgi:hypothetical protein